MEVIDAHRTAAVLPDLAQHVQAQHAGIAESPPTVGQEAQQPPGRHAPRAGRASRVKYCGLG